MLDEVYNAKISATFRINLGNSLEDHLRFITSKQQMTADYVNYLLQVYPDFTSANELEEILVAANSEYRASIARSEELDYSCDIGPVHRLAMSLQFRVPEEAVKQVELIDNPRMTKAWIDLYDASHQDFGSVVQKSLDGLAGAIKARCYPNDTKTNLADYAQRIRTNVDNLDLPNKDKLAWPELIGSLAKFIDRRSVHNSGTDQDPTYLEAQSVLHLCIALIIILNEKQDSN